MKNSIFSIIVIMLLTAVAPEAKSETRAANSSTGIIHILLGKNTNNSSSRSKRLRKRKLKKVVRKVARVYRDVKPDRESRKKSRKIQRKARRIINIF
jgi:vesicle coat complex subunit